MLCLIVLSALRNSALTETETMNLPAVNSAIILSNTKWNVAAVEGNVMTLTGIAPWTSQETAWNGNPIGGTVTMDFTVLSATEGERGEEVFTASAFQFGQR